MLGWVWVGVFIMEVKTVCLGVVIVGISGVFLWFSCGLVFCLVGWFFLNLNHDKVKFDFITKVI